MSSHAIRIYGDPVLRTRSADVTDIDETDIKQQYWRSEVVDSRLRTTFAPDDVDQAALLLAGLMGEDPHSEGFDEALCRMMLAALKVSGGNLVKLAAWIEVARQDPRDLIASAEYALELHDSSDESRRTDLAEYLAWISVS